MDNSSLINEVQPNLAKIKEQLFAGKAAIEPEQLSSFLSEFEEELNRVSEEDLLSKNEALLKNWEEIFAAVIPAQLASNIMKEIKPEIFYNFGQYLLKMFPDKSSSPNKSLNAIVHFYLDLFRFSEFLIRVYEQKKWEILIHDLIVNSNFNINTLFKQRVDDYGNRTLFKVLHGSVENDYSWNTIWERTQEYAKSILKLFEEIKTDNQSVAILMENELCMASLDLACLSNGIVNIMIPANSVPQHLSYILNQTKAPLLIISDEKQLFKIKSVKNELIYLKKVVIRHGSSNEEWIISFNEFINLSSSIPNTVLENRLKDNKVESLATVMYTSGTTGEPKGIMFSQVNIVYKRFCRAMAIPKISDRDRFLAFLPLYHTFGRWLEMMGSIFWGTTYVFMENPSVETMISNMKQIKPSIFISVPKKWVQLYEYISSSVDIEMDEEQIIQQKINDITGGKLKWGISAAGYLSPDIFQFFQKYNVELMSGFGMTEATGGITMTPPHKYIPNSLGKALPGIEIKLAEDGEILIRGPYVMMGYFGEKKEDTFLPGNWLPTGDIMQMDEHGFIEIIDRKKEIYKNIKGETIAPQKIENYFREFDFVKQVFLVGDHRPSNTVLIYPNYDIEDSIINNMDDAELHDYFSSVIVTVNKFLAPFERIVDFRIIQRPFTEDKGELTPKGTYKRRAIEKNFTDKIESMYIKDHTSITINDIEVRLPNWFLREKGCLSGDIIALPNGISIPKLQLSLKIIKDKTKPNIVRIGDFYYEINSSFIDMQLIFTSPLYWLGNKGLFEFTGNSIFQWFRQITGHNRIQFYGKAPGTVADPTIRETMKNLLSDGEQNLKVFILL